MALQLDTELSLEVSDCPMVPTERVNEGTKGSTMSNEALKTSKLLLK